MLNKIVDIITTTCIIAGTIIFIGGMCAIVWGMFENVYLKG